MTTPEQRIAELEQKVIELQRNQDGQAAAFLEFITKHETRLNDVISHFRTQVEMVLADAAKRP